MRRDPLIPSALGPHLGGLGPSLLRRLLPCKRHRRERRGVGAASECPLGAQHLDLLLPDARPPRGRGCEVLWRPLPDLLE
eukprot:6404284-Pyramimonas_sp.AAC.1